ncbi:MAG: helix-turn-helix transcriptional regulator [Terriglobia bacterium]
MNAPHSPTSELVATSRCGLVLLDEALHISALDYGARLILPDCGGSYGETSGSSHLPRPLADYLQTRSWTSISGNSVNIRGNRAVYRCTVFKIEPQTRGSGSPALAVYICRNISPEEAIEHVAAMCKLTDRELEVLRGVSTGLTSKEIAAELDISPNTVKSYLRILMVKIGVTTRSAIVGKLLKHAAGGEL